MTESLDQPSVHDVVSFLRNDVDDDDYMLFEVVSGVEQRFGLSRSNAVRLTHRAIVALLAEGVGELSFGHWGADPVAVPLESLPGPEDLVQWGYPPPDDRYWFYSNTERVRGRAISGIADVIARYRSGDVMFGTMVARIELWINSLTGIYNSEWLEELRGQSDRLESVHASMIDDGRRDLTPDEVEISDDALAALENVTRR